MDHSYKCGLTRRTCSARNASILNIILNPYALSLTMVLLILIVWVIKIRGSKLFNTREHRSCQCQTDPCEIKHREIDCTKDFTQHFDIKEIPCEEKLQIHCGADNPKREKAYEIICSDGKLKKKKLKTSKTSLRRKRNCN